MPQLRREERRSFRRAFLRFFFCPYPCLFEMLEGFSKYYDVMTPEDRKALLQAMISYIELYGEKRADGHFVKAIHFTFPVTYDGESGALFVRTNEQQVETVVLMTRTEAQKG